MPRSLPRLWLLLALICVASCSQSTSPPTLPPASNPCELDMTPGGEGLRILFIGNSLTYWNDLPGILVGLFEDAGVSFDRVESIVFPNFGLQDHWALPAVLVSIARGWDVVIMQQGPSATEGRPSLLQYSELFAQEIRAAGGLPALFMVWPADTRFFDFDGVSESYAMAAELVDGYLFPAGEAWRDAWEQDSSLQLYGVDGFHPGPLGSYLAALVMFEQLAGQSPTTLGGFYCNSEKGRIELDAELAALLQQAAAQANADFARVPDSLP